jgi:hypothetical protein
MRVDDRIWSSARRKSVPAFAFHRINERTSACFTGCDMWIVWLLAAMVVVVAAVVGIALLGLWARTRDLGM